VGKSKRSRNRERDRHGRAQAVAPVCLPVVTPLCIGAFLAFTQRPRVVADPPVSTAIDCTETAAEAKAKACTRCGVVKPLTDFHRSKQYSGGYNTACKACIKARDEYVTGAGLSARTVAESTASAGLVTVESLTADARRLKGRPAVYQRGRIRIEARYDRRADTTEFSVGGWPCPVDHLANVFDEIHSGRPTGWL
jgi:hypothetical protein